MSRTEKPYFYLKASENVRPVVRIAKSGGIAALCFQPTDGPWIDYTLEYSGGRIYLTERTGNDSGAGTVLWSGVAPILE